MSETRNAYWLLSDVSTELLDALYVAEHDATKSDTARKIRDDVAAIQRVMAILRERDAS